MVNPNIEDFSTIIPPTFSTEPVEAAPPKEKKPYDSDLSDIEESTNLALMMLTPPFNLPVLTKSSDQNERELLPSTIGTGSSPLLSYNLINDKAKEEILSGLSDNIREIAEQVRILLNSANFQMQQLLFLKGEPQIGGLESVIAPSAASYKPAIVSYINGLEAFERVPPSGNIPDESAPEDPAKTLILPLLGGMVVGGAATVGSLEMTTAANGITSNPFQGVAEFVSRLQPIFPGFIQDILPTINLLVMPLIYYTSWDASVTNIQNKEQISSEKAAQKFAESVIKMVNDPNFIYTTAAKYIPKFGVKSAEQQQQLTNVLKLILSTVALSLLYSLDVSKAMGNKFWGMEPQEFKALLMGDIPIPDPEKDKKKKVSESDKLKWKLLKQIKGQLGVMLPDEKAATLEAIFEYLTSTHNIKDMIDPAKVFNEILANNLVNSIPRHLKEAA